MINAIVRQTQCHNPRFGWFIKPVNMVILGMMHSCLFGLSWFLSHLVASPAPLQLVEELAHLRPQCLPQQGPKAAKGAKPQR
jgi:hypothetical protein